jgi:hypothetical protein
MKVNRMKNTTILKFLLLVTLLFIFLQCIYVSGAQQNESLTIKKELKVPAPALPTL